jgi:hypothetical protein
MIYNDNSCSRCGGIRVAKSTLCADCLVRDYENEIGRRLALQKIIDGQDLRIAKLTELVNRLLDHITNDRVSAGELATELLQNWTREKRGALNVQGRI